MASKRSLLAAAFIATSLAISAGAFAEPTPAERETARGLMTQGRNQRDSKDLKAALQSFQAADAIMKVPTTGLEVARTQELMGLLVEARDTALRTLRIAETPNEPVPFKDARIKAQAMSDDLEARIPSIRITVKGAPEGAAPSVSVDGAAISAAALSVPYKLNPGHHVIDVTAKGFAGKAEIDVGEKQTKDVDVALAPTGAVDTPPPPPPQDETPPPAPPPPPSGNNALMFTGFGLAGVGIIVGSITGLVSMSKKSDAASGCKDNRCPPSTYDQIDSAKTMATISTISFIAAGVGATVGIISLVLKRDPSPPPTQGFRATPWIGVGSAGVNGSF